MHPLQEEVEEPSKSLPLQLGWSGGGTGAAGTDTFLSQQISWRQGCEDIAGGQARLVVGGL